jgi:hypothetical protein
MVDDDEVDVRYIEMWYVCDWGVAKCVVGIGMEKREGMMRREELICYRFFRNMVFS